MAVYIGMYSVALLGILVSWDFPGKRFPIVNKNKSSLLFVLVMILFSIAIGFRHEVSVDWIRYTRIISSYYYLTLEGSVFKEDQLFFIALLINHLLGGDIYTINIFLACFFMLGIYVFCRAQYNPWLVLLVATPYMIIVIGMGYPRQSFALGGLMLAFVLLSQGKSFLPVFLILLSSLMHKSLMFFIPFAIFIAYRNRPFYFSAGLFFCGCLSAILLLFIYHNARLEDLYFITSYELFFKELVFIFAPIVMCLLTYRSNRWVFYISFLVMLIFTVRKLAITFDIYDYLIIYFKSNLQFFYHEKIYSFFHAGDILKEAPKSLEYGEWVVLGRDPTVKRAPAFVGEGYFQSFGVWPRIALNAIAAVIIIFYQRYFLKNWEERFMGIGIALCCLGSFFAVTYINVAVDRYAVYFSILQLLVFSRLPYLVYDPVKRTCILFGVVGLYGLIFFVWFNFGYYRTYWLPYQFMPLS